MPQAACAQDFANFGITQSPATFNSDTVRNFEVGAKNNFEHRVRIASSIYYIRWNDIQQTVLPPICQITWIQNLGQAVAKGADIQAEFAVTDAFHVELSAGYTDARYTRGSFVGSSTSGLPVAATGDAITGQGGQPGPPVTAAVGLEYHFTSRGHESFVRADYEYAGRAKWQPPGQDPSTLQYDTANFVLPPTSFVTLRVSTTMSGWQVAAFVDNLFDTRPVTNYSFTINPQTGADRLERAWSFRPRTIGLDFTYRR